MEHVYCGYCDFLVDEEQRILRAAYSGPDTMRLNAAHPLLSAYRLRAAEAKLRNMETV